jgi:D-xylose reductase
MNEYVTLHNKVKMPRIGFGTWQLQGQECIDAVYDAIVVGKHHSSSTSLSHEQINFIIYPLGYRLFDTAEAYRNEAEVATAIHRAIDEGIVTREELFIATKQSDPDHAGYDGIRELIQSQLDTMRLDYFDLYMLHSPLDKSFQVIFLYFFKLLLFTSNFKLSILRIIQGQTWLALEELNKAGILKAIGVSNFDGRELRLLVGTAKSKPMMVQNKLDVYHYGKQLDNKGQLVHLIPVGLIVSLHLMMLLSFHDLLIVFPGFLLNILLVCFVR